MYFRSDVPLIMKHPVFPFLRWSFVVLVLVLGSVTSRAQTISNAVVNGLGLNWVGTIGTPAVITGSGFAPSNTPSIVAVRFAGTLAGYSVVSDSQINVGSIPVGATSGLLSVIRSNLDGTFSTNFSTEVFYIAGTGPFVTTFTPNTGSGETVVNMTGIRLQSIPGTNGIFFNGKRAVAASIISSNQIVATSPPDVASGPITVMSSIAPIGTNNTFSNFFAPSLIASFSPTFGRANTNVVIQGTNFTGVTSVLFNGLPSSYNVDDNGQITARVPTNATTGPLTVTEPGGNSITVSNFVVQPTITSFSPIFGAAGTNVTIRGANFNVGTPIVTFNGVTSAVPTSITFTSLVAVVPVGTTTGPIQVSTVDGSSATVTNFFLRPIITDFSPTNSAPGSIVTINGTNFLGATAVRFNGTPAGFTNVSNFSLQATVPTNFLTGPITIVVPGSSNSTATLATSNFYGAPIITSFSPTHGILGTNVTLRGTNFLGTTQITFNGVPGTSLVVLSNNAVRVTVPTNATTGPLALTAPANSATTITNFVLDYLSDLAVAIASTPNPATNFGLLNYSVDVTNRGPADALAVVLTNALPANVLLQGTPAVSQGTWATNGNFIIASFGTVVSNGTANLSFTVSPQVPDVTLMDIANATSGYTDPVLSNNLATNFVTVVAAEIPPLLSVSFTPPDTILLSWPSSFTNYVLQFNPDLLSTNWSNVLTAPIASAGTNTVTETNANPMMYYRLMR